MGLLLLGQSSLAKPDGDVKTIKVRKPCVCKTDLECGAPVCTGYGCGEYANGGCTCYDCYGDQASARIFVPVNKKQKSVRSLLTVPHK